MKDENELILKEYTDGYNIGVEKRIEEIENEGFKYAFENELLEIPAEYRNIGRAAKAFENGFNSNAEVIQMKKIAYQNGKYFFKTSLESGLENYPYSQTIYEKYYKRGKSEAVEVYILIISIASVIITISASMIFFIMKK